MLQIVPNAPNATSTRAKYKSFRWNNFAPVFSGAKFDSLDIDINYLVKPKPFNAAAAFL